MTTLHAEVRIRLERELADLEAGSLALMRAAGAPYANLWDLAPVLVTTLETITSMRMIDKDTLAGWTDREALERAADRLGLDPEALRKRIERLHARTRMSETAGYDEVDSTRIAS